jgi:threonyl-tRNA synthetase
MSKVTVTFPDGNTKEYESGVTAREVASSISEGLAREALAAAVNDRQVDLDAPIAEDATVRFFTFKDPEGRHVFWHSSSHLMAHAVQELFPEAKFGVGPAIENGFYYDIDINRRLGEDDLESIEKKMKELAKRDETFARKELAKSEALKFFSEKGDPYKIELIEGIDENDETISIYTEGDFVDLCSGPHVPSVGKIKHFKLLSVSGSYWRGDENNKQLQRIYGISFPKKKQLDEHLHKLEEAKKRDHRKLGVQLDLFSIHEEAGAGMVYWHPKGALIRHLIETFWRDEHLANGYELLYTPHVGKSRLWETSGHLGFYAENMFAKMEIDEQDYYIKPMNCPFHIMIYNTSRRSYRELPLRWAELGTVYRYEKSGVLHGLFRVRAFTQDDAHIICTPEQIESEVEEVIRFNEHMWKAFGFPKLKYYLSTKPEKAVGEDELWDKAIASLRNALEKKGVDYEVDEGGGAFYGPKIDIKITDALDREWQTSTVQFDFNLPERFDMTYIGSDGAEHRPLMVHRALLGSIERFFGILTEHYGGAFPAWLAPVQVAVVPVSLTFMDYAREVADRLKAAGARVELDDRSEKIGYKIRDWETKKAPYMAIVGEKEMNERAVSVRRHKVGDLGAIPLDTFVERLTEEVEEKSEHSLLETEPSLENHARG